MNINKEDAKRIAELARLELSEKEIEEIAPQLSEILGYIGELSEVDTSAVSATAQVTGLTNVFREDEYSNWPADEKALALEQTPDGLLGGAIQVKRVLD